jgi:PAS domain S-box-containing protein
MEVIVTTGTQPLHIKDPRAKHPLRATPLVEPVDLSMLVLNDHGMIQFCSQACEQVFGYLEDDLKGLHISTLLPQLENTTLVLDDRINSRLAFLCHCGIPFQAQHRDGNRFTIELFINRLSSQNVVVLMRCLDASVSSLAPVSLRQCGNDLANT